MKTLLDICKGGIFHLGEKRYKLYPDPIAGGSSLVYVAEILHENEKGFYMIKEFFPDVLGAVRGEDGTVTFPLADATTLRHMKEKARRESIIANNLRYENLTNSAWVFQYHMPIEQNNTLYTVIQTEKGHMLSTFFKKKTAANNIYEMDFVTACEHILLILDALEPIHKKNCLHLDVSPSNIHISEAGFARLIDYNSAYSMGKEISEELTFSINMGYSAPELIKWYPGKPPTFTFATDLYSVAAILFQILTGEKTQRGDYYSLAWHLNKNSLHMKDTAQLLIDETNAFLKKGIAMQKRRFQSTSEMRQAVKKLIELCVALEISDNRKPAYENEKFVGRDKELKEIDEKLNEHKYFFIEGIGGIGKTEIAKRYADTSGKKYRIVQFITFNENLQTTIAEELTIQNFDRTKYERAYGKNRTEFIKHVYADKMEILKKCGEDTLIIVDNCDVNVDYDKEYQRFVAAGACKIIFTSRMTHDVPNKIEVLSMESRDDLFALFNAYYKKELAEEEKTAVGKIIDLVQGHTMVIMLIAASMQENSTPPAEMFACLRESFDTGFAGAVKVKKEELTAETYEQVMHEHLRMLFNMEKFDEDERKDEKCREVMMDMSLVYLKGIEKRQFLHWTSSRRYHYPLDERDNFEYLPEEYSYIEQLIRLRWIQYDAHENRISLHAAVSEIVSDTLQPNCYECHCLLSAFRDCAEATDGMTYARQTEWLEMVDFACKRLKRVHIHSLAFDLYHNKAITHGNLGMYTDTVKCCDAALRISDEVEIDAARVAAIYATRAEANIALFDMEEAERDTKQQTFLADATGTSGGPAKRYVLFVLPCFQKGKRAKALGKSHEAIMHFTEALEYCKEIYGPSNNKHSAAIMDFIAMTYSDLGELEKALHIYENNITVYDNESADFAACYANIGEVYVKQGLLDPSKLNIASQHFQKGLNIFAERYESDFLPPIANIHHNLGVVYHAKHETDKALECFKKALEIREIIYADSPNHVHVGESYMAIGDCCYTDNNYAEAIVNAEKSLTIFNGAFSDRRKKHDLIFKSYFLLSMAYSKEGEMAKAIEAGTKACAVAEEVYDNAGKEVFQVYKHLGFICRDENHDWAAALEYLKKALHVAENIFPPFSPTVNELKIAIGELL
jgi:tetratricopeptide (TPR) repeat protein/serine/threonine protein kinase